MISYVFFLPAGLLKNYSCPPLPQVFSKEAGHRRHRLLRFESQFVELHDANLTQRRQGAKTGNFNRGPPFIIDARGVSS
jgi:hypothetical protein